MTLDRLPEPSAPGLLRCPGSPALTRRLAVHLLLPPGVLTQMSSKAHCSALDTSRQESSLRSFRWCASLASVAGLAGSVLLGAFSAVPAQAQTPASVPALTVAAPRGLDAATSSAGTARPRGGNPGAPQTACLGLVPPPYAYAAHTPFVCGDWRFGPVRLPETGILSGYHRFGPLTPVEFLNKWWDPTAELGLGDWKYPPDQGFAHDNSGHVLAAKVTLHPGTLVDRFGDEFGRFLAPAGGKFAQRALPPSSLNTVDPRYPYGYHLYRVIKDTVLCSGPQAPAFEQPGQGVQYVTSKDFCPDTPGMPDVVGRNVKDLVDMKYLQRAN